MYTCSKIYIGVHIHLLQTGIWKGRNYVQKNCKHNIIGWQTRVMNQS